MFQANSIPGLTLGQIAARLGVAQHRIKYAITRCGIQPIGRVGIIRIFDEAELPRLRRAVFGVAATPAVSKGGGQ